MAHQTLKQPRGVKAVLQGVQQNTRSTLQLFSLEGRVCVVTGGMSGLGREIAFAYAEAGAIVYCIDQVAHTDADFVKLQKYVAEQSQGRIEYMSCDATKQKDVWAVMEKIAEQEGRLDTCVACAGMLSGAEVLDYPAEDFQKVMAANVNTVLYSAQGAGRMMAKHNTPGSIILMSSISGHVTNRGMHWTAFNASKAAVIQMARSMACELGPKNIRCNSISPGYGYSDQVKPFLDANPKVKELWCSQNCLGRLANPEEVCGAALFLGSDASTYCTGSDIVVDAGHTAW